MSETRMGIIYMFTHTPTGRSYIGKTIDPKRRYHQHFYYAYNKRDTHNKFHNALRKYPKDEWEYIILEENIPQESLDAKEIYYIKKYQTFEKGFNMTHGGDGIRYLAPWNKGKKWDEETIKKISESRKGSVSGFKGHKHSPESIEQMKQKLKGKPSPFKGRKLTEEQKRKISESQKRRYAKNKSNK